MNKRFISGEELLATPKDFQKDFIAWWKDNIQIGDYFTWIRPDNHDNRLVECVTEKTVLNITKESDERIPCPNIEMMEDYIKHVTGGDIEEVYNDITGKLQIEVYVDGNCICMESDTIKMYSYLGICMKVSKEFNHE